MEVQDNVTQSRYNDSESITFIFSRHEVLRRICQESAVTAERSASRIDNQRKLSGSFLFQLHGAGPKGGGSLVACTISLN
jgi:hypothetical protein